MRSSEVNRKTKETDIRVKLTIEGSGQSKISTPFPFFNHLLESFAKHGRFDLEIHATGDNEHHIVEDVAIVLGRAFSQAIGDKRGIERFGHAILPMDDVLLLVAVDISGRAYVSNGVKFRYKAVEGLSTEMIEHFIESFGNEMKINLHAKLLSGKNEHHKAEALFKALGVALRRALQITSQELPSTKGLL